MEKCDIDVPSLLDENELYQLYLCEVEDDSLNKSEELIKVLVKIHSMSRNVEYSELELEEFYKNILHEIEDIRNYYLKLQDYIENFSFPKISYYFIIINISLFYNILNLSEYYLSKWYDKKNYNILKGYTIKKPYLNNFHCGRNKYFINNDFLSYDLVIYDIVSFYKKEILNVDYSFFDYYFNEINVDKDLFFALICIPNVIRFSDNNYNNILKIRNEINYINETFNFISEKNKENQKANK